MSALPAIGAKAALAIVIPAAFRKLLLERLFCLRDVTFISSPLEVSIQHTALIGCAKCWIYESERDMPKKVAIAVAELLLEPISRIIFY
jgi:hypothetical protein